MTGLIQWSRHSQRVLTWFAVFAFALAGCDKSGSSGSSVQFNAIDLTGASYAQDFALTDHSGVRRTLADYRGKLVVVFFGFTHCPDVCPTAMVDMVEVRKKLGANANKLQVIFITLDPERDTQEVLSKYVPAFDPSFVGLVGTTDETTQVAREFKVFYQKVPLSDGKSYSLDHSAGRYVFDSQGKIRLLIRPNQSVDTIAQDLSRLL